MAEINNECYETLGERWYEAWDDPIALLRAESKLKHPWIIERISKHFKFGPVDILDVGCGAGFLTNELAGYGHKVTGIDLSGDSLRVARNHDHTHTVDYREADAFALPFHENSFDVVTCMDFLEHVHSPGLCIQEISRVLKPGGLFFFHTFNRNLVSWVLVIKGVEWLVKNTPKNMHVIELFIKPAELERYCHQAGMETEEWTGIRPVFSSIPIKNLFTRIVPPGLKFVLTDSLGLSYMGYAIKNS